MRDIEYRPGEQFRLAVAEELTHRGIDAEQTGVFGIDFDDAYTAGIKHGTECHFALAESGFGAFEVRDVGDCCDQPDDFVAPPFRLVIAMDDLWLVGPVSQIDFDLKRDRLAGE